MNFLIKTFDQLSNVEIYSILKLRSAVFVLEQKCAYQDIDDLDQKAEHVMLFEGKELIAYSRILPPGLVYKTPAIGRVAVDNNHRKQGLGKILMKYNITKTFELFDSEDCITISAQKYLLKFYSELGFKVEGEEYLEDDIPHIKMKYKIMNK